MKKSNLLLKEPPLVILPSLAGAIGLNEAIIVQQLHYWLENKKSGVERDGHKWIFNTYEEWQVNFPFWSVATIRRIFQNLEKIGVIVSAQFDANKHDQTKFYRLDYLQIEQLEMLKMSSSNSSICADGDAHIEQLLISNTETTTDIKPLQKTSNSKPSTDALGGWLGMHKEHEEAMLQITEIINEFERGLMRSDDLAGNSKWQDFVKTFVLREDKKGNSYKRWIEWFRSDPTRLQWAWKETPETIKARWLIAFSTQAGNETQRNQRLPSGA